ncbi:transposase family protein, partial [Azotobacter beijerinckii]
MPSLPMPITDVFVSLADPRQTNKVQHSLAETLTVAVCGILVGADTFEEIQAWAREKLPWLRRYLELPNGIPSHDTFA